MNLRNLLTAAALAGVIGAAPVVASTEASAQYYGHGYGHHGYHGHHGGVDGGALAAGLLGGLAVGAFAGNGYGYGHGHHGGHGYYGGGHPVYSGYGGCYIARQPVTDDWGNVVYYQRVRVCE